LKRSLIQDAELFELTRIFLPGNIHMFYNCSLRAMPAPFNQFSDVFLGPFAENFYTAISEVSHTAREAKFVRLPLGTVAVEDSLDPTRDQYLRPSHH
jgi:hypothetical protein